MAGNLPTAHALRAVPAGCPQYPPATCGGDLECHSPLTPRDGPREAAPSCCTSEVPECYGEPPLCPRGRSCLTPARELLRRESWTGRPLTSDAREAGGRHQRAGLKTRTRCAGAVRPTRSVGGCRGAWSRSQGGQPGWTPLLILLCSRSVCLSWRPGTPARWVE